MDRKKTFRRKSVVSIPLKAYRLGRYCYLKFASLGRFLQTVINTPRENNGNVTITFHTKFYQLGTALKLGD